MVYLIGICIVLIFNVFGALAKVITAPVRLAGNALGVGGPDKKGEPVRTDPPSGNLVIDTKTSFMGKLLKGVGATILIGGAGYGAYKLTESLNKPVNNFNIPGNYTSGTYINRFAVGGQYPLPGCCNGYGMMTGCCPQPPMGGPAWPPPTNAFGLDASGHPYSMSSIMWDYQQMFGPMFPSGSPLMV